LPSRSYFQSAIKGNRAHAERREKSKRGQGRCAPPAALRAAGRAATDARGTTIGAQTAAMSSRLERERWQARRAIGKEKVMQGGGSLPPGRLGLSRVPVR